MFNFNKAEISAIGKTVGLTIVWSSEWNEFRVYPKGTGVDHPSAYFTSDGEDAVRTALMIVQGKEIGEPREFTMSEQLDIEINGEWYLEDGYADHPIGDRLEAIGDNVYRIHRNETWEYYFSLKEALES